MTLVTIDLGDVAGDNHPDDYVVIRAEAFRESHGGGITSTAEVKVPLVDGVGQAEVEPGPVVVAFRCQAVADTREKRGVVPDEGTVGIEEVIAGAFEYAPAIVNRGLDLIEGARDEALGQVEGAVAAEILSSGETVREMVGMVEADPIEDTEWAHISANGDRLPLGYAADGRLDWLARQVWREDTVGIFDHDAPSDWSHALTTEDGRLLFGIRTSGEIIAPGLVGGGGPVSQDVYVHSDGTVQHTMADMDKVTTWGSSTPDLMTDALTVAFSDTDAEVAKQAKGGEWIEHHAARLGVVPALIDPVTIPTSGGVAVTISNFPPNMAYNYAMRTFTGTLAGIQGSLSASREQFTFTRTTAGSEVTVTEPTGFLPDVGPATRDHVIILGPGKNNLTQSTTGEQEVIEYTDKIFDYLTPLHPRCIVLAHHNNTGWSAESVTKQRIARVNDHYRRRFGPLFFDVHTLITGPEIWQRTGITPTQQDLDEQALGNLAPSLGRDTLHFNETANHAIAQAIREHVNNLGWY